MIQASYVPMQHTMSAVFFLLFGQQIQTTEKQRL